MRNKISENPNFMILFLVSNAEHFGELTHEKHEPVLNIF